jgi:hypothetical protein
MDECLRSSLFLFSLAGLGCVSFYVDGEIVCHRVPAPNLDKAGGGVVGTQQWIPWLGGQVCEVLVEIALGSVMLASGKAHAHR